MLFRSWKIDREIRARARENTDLLTLHTAEVMERAWRTHQRAHDGAARLRTQEKAGLREERTAGLAAHRGRRIIPPGPTIDEAAPPF